MKRVLTGLVAAPHSPFDVDGVLSLTVVKAQAELLKRNGVCAAFICGTTGEGSSLSTAERMQVAEAWISHRPPGLKVAIHVGHNSGTESQALAKHAASIGADAIAALSPNFFKPAGADELIEWCSAVAGAAPATPFYYYHMPAMTGVSIPVSDFIAKAEKRIPTLAGVKYTHEDLLDYGRSLDICAGRMDMLFGRDEMLLSGMVIGGAGAVGSTYNFAAPLYVSLLTALRDGDLESAGTYQKQAREMIAVLNRHGGLAAGKMVMKLIGIDCGAVRLPLRRLTNAQEGSLRAGLEAVGFFEYCSKAH